MFILSQNSLQLSRGRPLPLASILASETSKVSCLSTFLWYLNYKIYRARRRVAGALGRQCLQRLAQWPFWGAVGGGGGRDLRSPSIPLQPLRSPASLWCSTLGSFPAKGSCLPWASHNWPRPLSGTGREATLSLSAVPQGDSQVQSLAFLLPVLRRVSK